jgi:hypothetical protein
VSSGVPKEPKKMRFGLGYHGVSCIAYGQVKKIFCEKKLLGRTSSLFCLGVRNTVKIWLEACGSMQTSMFLHV